MNFIVWTSLLMLRKIKLEVIARMHRHCLPIAITRSLLMRERYERDTETKRREIQRNKEETDTKTDRERERDT